MSCVQPNRFAARAETRRASSHGGAQPRPPRAAVCEPNLFPNHQLGTATIGILPASRLLTIEICAIPWHPTDCILNYVPPVEWVRIVLADNRWNRSPTPGASCDDGGRAQDLPEYFLRDVQIQNGPRWGKVSSEIRWNTALSEGGGAESGAVGAPMAELPPDLAMVVNAWPSLSDAARKEVLQVIRRETSEEVVD